MAPVLPISCYLAPHSAGRCPDCRHRRCTDPALPALLGVILFQVGFLLIGQLSQVTPVPQFTGEAAVISTLTIRTGGTDIVASIHGSMPCARDTRGYQPDEYNRQSTAHRNTTTFQAWHIRKTTCYYMTT